MRNISKISVRVIPVFLSEFYRELFSYLKSKIVSLSDSDFFIGIVSRTFRTVKFSKYLLFLFAFSFIACDDDALPKPKAYLSLKYPAPNYQKLNLKKPYSFEISDKAKAKDLPNGWMKITYPKLKASLDITYRKVDDNLQEILIEAEKLVYKHTQKAEQILAKNFDDKEKRVFGSLQEITGNAASQIQFHATDSTNHFIKGALYFYAKPNYDSILPAVDYIKKDILRLMETIEWKNEKQ